MEFLMTYGWAILVVLIVIGALAYFGVLDPTKLLPDKCNFPAGFYCTDHRVEQSKIQFLLQNGLGKDLLIYGITAVETSANILQNCSTTWVNAGTPLVNGGSATFILNKATPGGAGAAACSSTVSVGRKYKYDLKVTYNFTGGAGFTHTMEGELFSKVES